MTAQIADVVERLEKATGPDRELDGAIVVAMDWQPAGFQQQDRPWLWVDFIGGSSPDFDSWAAPQFTSSIDAAMTLVPEDHECVLHTHDYPSRDGRPRAYLKAFGARGRRVAFIAKAHTLPLALCIAALRARSQP